MGDRRGAEGWLGRIRKGVVMVVKGCAKRKSSRNLKGPRDAYVGGKRMALFVRSVVAGCCSSGKFEIDVVHPLDGG